MWSQLDHSGQKWKWNGNSSIKLSISVTMLEESHLQSCFVVGLRRERYCGEERERKVVRKSVDKFSRVNELFTQTLRSAFVESTGVRTNIFCWSWIYKAHLWRKKTVKTLFHLFVISPVILFLKYTSDRNLVKTREFIHYCQKETESGERSRGWGFPCCWK